LNETRLRSIAARFPGLRVVVLGDFFLDKYLEIERALSEPSLETGLEAHQVTAVRVSPGGAGTVINNLVAMGVPTALVGVIGDTGEGYELRRCFSQQGVDTLHLLMRPDRFTPTYTKPMMHETDGRVHELSRLDIKNRTPLPAEVEDELIASLRAAVSGAGAVLVSEYLGIENHGAVTERVRAEVLALAQANPAQVWLADSRAFTARFRHVGIKCNVHEAQRAWRPGSSREVTRLEAAALGREYAQRNGRPAFITLGAGGILACDERGSVHVPAVPVTGPTDPVGAGDSVLAAIGAALAAGATNEEAALFGNLAAGVTVRKIGVTGTATVDEMAEQLGIWEGR
jgi:rfaE bifunctional protein kinase chain/domain